VFVGNLPFTVNEVILENTAVKLLGPGMVAAVRLIRDEHGRPRGFGYVDLQLPEGTDTAGRDAAVAAAVLKIKGKECMGRLMRADSGSRQRQQKKSI
jgi:RNA recognition motif-containing protein